MQNINTELVIQNKTTRETRESLRCYK